MAPSEKGCHAIGVLLFSGDALFLSMFAGLSGGDDHACGHYAREHYLPDPGPTVTSLNSRVCESALVAYPIRLVASKVHQALELLLPTLRSGSFVETSITRQSCFGNQAAQKSSKRWWISDLIQSLDLTLDRLPRAWALTFIATISHHGHQNRASTSLRDNFTGPKLPTGIFEAQSYCVEPSWS